MFYLISRDADRELTWPLDVNSLGSYMSVRYGPGQYFSTKEEAFNHLIQVAYQRQNLVVGSTKYIIDENGYEVWNLRVVLVETFKD